MLAARASEGPPLIVIEAPTGSGKSEAALMTAEVLAARFGCGGIFVALPTMATSDAMFNRVHAWVEQLPGQGETSLWLAHSKASLNPKFAEIVRGSRVVGVYDEDVREPSQDLVTRARVSSWLSGRKRGLLANFVIGTIDQVLMGGLQSRHVALRHLGLSGKVVVVDEVHAADDYMRAYLVTMLRYLGAYGTPVILLSATLPPRQREELVAAYRQGRLGSKALSGGGSREPEDSEGLDATAAYPRITVATGKVRDVSVSGHASGRSVKLEAIADDLPTLIRVLTVALAEGGCVAVIRNTVGRAQQTFDALQGALGGDVELLHSRFMAPHRAVKEGRLLRRLGPPDQSERPRRLVVVGTQVLEQSLDIDVDLMVTDIAPADVVLQRIGRLHRHDRPAGQRPKGLIEPRCLVAGVEDWDSVPPRITGGSVAVYGQMKLLKSISVLQEFLGGRALKLPGDVPGLVRTAYEPMLQAPLGWEAQWVAAEEVARREYADQVSRSRAFRLPEVHQRSTLVDWLPAPTDERAGSGGRAQVRDGADGVEVVLVLWDGGEGLRTLPGDYVGADKAIPVVVDDRDPIAREVASCTVRLPWVLTVGRQGEEIIDVLERAAPVSGWQHSRWLQGQLVLPLDSDFRATVAGFDLVYSQERGLEARRSSGKDL